MSRSLRVVTSTIVWATILPLSTGCSRYLVHQPNQTAPKQWSQVRVALRAPTEYPAGRLMVGDAAILIGAIMEQRAEEVVLSLNAVQSATGVEHPAVGEQVTIPKSNLHNMEVKRFAPLPTVGLIGAITVGVVLVPVAVFGGDNEGSGGENNNQNPTFPRRAR